MARSVEAAERERTVAKLKRLITAGHFSTQEMLEEAVDHLLWGEHDRRQTEQPASIELARVYPK